MENYTNISSFIFRTADQHLRNLFKPHQYGSVILPFVVLRRLDSVIENKKEEILDLHKSLKKKSKNYEKIILGKTKLNFINISRYDLKKLAQDDQDIFKNFINYLNGFSENVIDILLNFELEKNAKKLSDNGRLYALISTFASLDFSPDSLTNSDIGLIFEDILRQFSELSNEKSGEHYTPRDVIKLIAKVITEDDKNILSKKGKVTTIFDPCCGTGGMLTTTKNWIKSNLNKKANVFVFGQEINPETYATCKAEMLITGDDPENIREGDSLQSDKFSNMSFEYMITNPPFGENWSTSSNFINEEINSLNNRFKGGLPSKSDGQLLFLQHLISKMDKSKKSKIAIVFNGSPMFSGEASSGESKIRKWLLDNDYIETVFALPDQLFFNTPINIFVWLLTNQKSKNLKGKIKFIDCSSFFKKLKKSIGKKSKIIENNHINEILEIYRNPNESSFSKTINNSKFIFKEITIEHLNPAATAKIKTTERIPIDLNLEDYLDKRVRPYINDFDIDRSRIIEGAEITYSRIFYKPKIIKDLYANTGEIDFSLKSIQQKAFDFIKHNKDDLENKRLSKITVYNSQDEIKNYGSFPENWEIKRNKDILTLKKNLVGENSDQYTLLTMGINGVRIRDVESGKGKFPKSFEKYQIIKKGDLIFCLFDIEETPRTVGLSNLEGMITGAYDVFRVSKKIYPKFLYYYYLSLDLTKSLKPYYTGLRNTVRIDSFLNLKVAYPKDINEQKFICNEIENKLLEVDNIIDENLKIQNELTDFKNNLVHNVFRGKYQINKK